jgi:hypothetical protein
MLHVSDIELMEIARKKEFELACRKSMRTALYAGAGKMRRAKKSLLSIVCAWLGNGLIALGRKFVAIS